MNTVKLSNVINGQAESLKIPCGDGFVLNHVEIDVEEFQPPEGLKAISFVAKFDDEGNGFDDMMFDVAISYALSGVDVTIEIPFDVDLKMPSTAYVVRAASNAGFNLTYLLPENDCEDETFQKYLELIKEVTDTVFSIQNLMKDIFPVTNHLQYLFYEIAGGDPSKFRVDDEYIIDITKNVGEDRINKVKETIRKKIFEIYGGEEKFKNIAMAIFSKIYQKTDEIISDFAKSMKNEQQLNN